MLTSLRRPTFDEMNLSLGKRARLHRLMYEHGPANGTLMLLPLDQGLEHGPIDFFANPDSIDTDWVLRLAVEGKFSGFASHVGLAEKYMKAYAGRVPLVLKINGKTNIPSDDDAFSPLSANVEDAVRLGADAVGYTLYVGSPAQDRDIAQCEAVRRDCEKYGMPLIVWSYPRGSAVKAKGGIDGLYAVDYAARVACEVGADIVKLNQPKWEEEKASASPKPYNTLKLEEHEALAKVVKSAGRTLVLVSGGSKLSDEDTYHKAQVAMEAGCVGLIFGRNMWQRKWDDALAMSARMHKLMEQFGQ
ncbi:MAG TPA: fructose-bisphosphate aldolase [Candidatus Dormibacteraeota bacterium]|nr:fructose-bisphosphate aldolase [Candidatus Dormibacteraeota bacterium]